MKDKLFPDFTEILLGTHGQRWPELGGTLVEPWRMIHSDYLGGLEISEASVKRYCRGYTQYPRPMRKYYLGKRPGDLSENIKELLCGSTSLTKICSIQEEVHTWLETAELPALDKERLERLYVAQSADPTEIAAYLAGVMHCVIALS